MKRWPIRCIHVAIALASAALAPLAHAQCVDWSPDFRLPGNGINGTVHAVKTVSMPAGERLIAVGQFTLAGSAAATNVAQWDGSSWAPLGNWTSGGVIRAIEVFNDGTGPAIYVGGNFGTEQSGVLSDLAKWDGSSWVSVGGNTKGEIYALRAFVNQGVPSLFVAGRVTDAGGQPTEGVASWNGSTWQRWYATPTFSNSSVMYDTARGRVVLLGTSDSATTAPCETWEWNGTDWSKAATAGPVRRNLAASTFDPIAQRVLLMGGNTNTTGEARNTLWSWNGTAWTSVSVAPAGMIASESYGLAYDVARQKLVCFGGRNTAGTFSSQTWEFDGTTWTLLTPALAPTARIRPAMAYDPVSQRVVLFGGETTTGHTGDTWDWNGTQWTLRANTGPAPRTGALLAYEPESTNIILAHGVSTGNTGRDVWSWNGTAWTQLAPTDLSIGSSGTALFDAARGRLVLNAVTHTRGLAAPAWQIEPRGGFTTTAQVCTSLEVHDDGTGARLYAGGTFNAASGITVNGLARLEGNVWTRAGAQPRTSADLIKVTTGPAAGLWAFGVFAGNSKVARWNGSDWQILTTTDQSFSLTSSFTGDLGAGECLLAVGTLTDTSSTPVPAVGPTLLQFDGSRWSVVNFREPRMRTRAALAYDPVRNRTILFGGTTTAGAAGALSDTEEFDGRTWTPRAISGPSARFAHAMTFDIARGKALLVGGTTTAGTPDGQTWTLDASGWTLAAPSIAGQARQGHALTYDSQRQRAVLFGGRNAAGVLTSDTWEWDGATWTLKATTGPSARDRVAMAYDPVRQKTILVGGAGANNLPINDMWTWDGTQWTNLGSGINAFGHSMYFDESAQRVVLIDEDQAYEFDSSNNWIPHTGDSGLTAVHLRAATYDSLLNTPVLIGGSPLADIVPSPLGSTRIKRTNFESPSSRLSDSKSSAMFGAGPQRRLFLATELADRPSDGVAVFGAPCSPPTVVLQPVNATAIFNQSVVLSTLAVGTQPMSYQWRLNGVPVVNEPGRLSGAQSPTLDFGNTWNFGDAGVYDCVVTNPLGQSISSQATFTVDGVGSTGPVFLTKILYPPESVTNDPSIELTAFSPALFSDEGRVIFNATYRRGAETGSAVADWRDGQTSVVLRTGQTPAEIEESSTLTSIQPADISHGSGNSLIFGTLTGAFEGPYAQGLWSDHDGTQRLVARQGLGAPGTQCVLSSFGPSKEINRQGTIAFSGSLAGGDALPSNAYGIFTWNPTEGTNLGVRIGTILPGSTTPLTHIDSFTLADDNTINMYGRTDGRFGYWCGPPGALVRRAQVGDPALGFAPGLTFLTMHYSAAASDGRLCFTAQVEDAPNFKHGLYLSTPAGLTLWAKTGDPVPGVEEGATFNGFHPIVLNESGQLLFGAYFACGDCVSGQGLFLREPDGQIRLIMRGRDTPPPGVSSQFTTAGAIGSSILNDLGQVVFSAAVGTNSPNQAAVFGWTAETGVFSILSPAQQVQIAPQTYRTVVTANVNGVNSTDPFLGVSKSLNSQGRVVIRAFFSDNTSGLFLGTFGQFLTAAFSCPTIALPLTDQSVRVGRTVTLTGEGGGEPPLAYRWLRDGAPVVDDARISGATTNSLTITSAQLQDNGLYTLEVSNHCSELATTSAQLAVLCTADLDNGQMLGVPDGGVSIDDLLYFLVGFENGDVAVDVDNGTATGTLDDAVDINDLVYFLIRFEMGC